MANVQMDCNDISTKPLAWLRVYDYSLIHDFCRCRIVYVLNLKVSETVCSFST